MSKKAFRGLYNVIMKACEEGRVPPGDYGPDTMRSATPGEMASFGLNKPPLVRTWTSAV